MNEIVFFPGCMPLSTARHQYRAEKKLLKKLNWKIIECPEFSCCGGGHLQDASEEKFIALNARNLAYAQQKAPVLVTGCSTCYQNLMKVSHLLEDEKLRNRVNQKLSAVGVPLYEGKIQIRHILNFLNDEANFYRLQTLIKNPLEISVLPFYGCHIKRPTALLKDNPDGKLERLLQLCGCLPRPMKDPYSCCGFHCEITAPKTSSALSSAILKEAQEQQTLLIATLCPLCAFNLENHQIESKTQTVIIQPFEEILLRAMEN